VITRIVLLCIGVGLGATDPVTSDRQQDPDRQPEVRNRAVRKGRALPCFPV
jgi:hypothetical protein